MTSQWDAYESAIRELEEGNSISIGRRKEIFRALIFLVQRLHNLDHKTSHDSTDKIFDIAKGFQKNVDILKCDHQERADRFFDVENKEEAKNGLRECEVCKVQYHISTLKEYFGLDVK